MKSLYFLIKIGVFLVYYTLVTESFLKINTKTLGLLKITVVYLHHNN